MTNRRTLGVRDVTGGFARPCEAADGAWLLAAAVVAAALTLLLL